MWKEAVSLAAAAGAACVLRSEYEKKHFSVEVTEIISPKLERDRNLIFLSTFTITSLAGTTGNWWQRFTV